MVDEKTVRMLDELIEASLDKLTEIDQLERTLRVLDELRKADSTADFFLPLEVINVDAERNVGG